MPLWPALLANLSVALAFGLIPPLIPALARAFEVSPGAAGVSAVAVQAAFGVLAFRLGRRGIATRAGLLGGLIGLAAANLLSALAPDLVAYIVARVGAGVAMGVTYAAGLGIVTAGENVPRRAALYGAALPAAGLMVPVGGLLTDRLDWRAAHVFMALLPAAVAALIALRGAARLPVAPRPGRRVEFPPGVWIGFVSVALWATGTAALWVYVGEYAHQTFAGTASLTGMAVAMNGVAGFLGASLASRLSAGFRARAGIAAFVATILAVLALVRSSSALSFLVAISLWGFFHWVAFAVYQGLLTETVSAGLAGRVLTFFQVPASVGVSLGPLVGGLVLGPGRFGALGVFTVLGLAAGAGMFVVAWPARFLPTPGVATLGGEG